MKIIYDGYGRPHPVFPEDARGSDLIGEYDLTKKQFYITGELQSRLTAAAEASGGGKSEEEIIRDALRSYLSPLPGESAFVGE